MTRWGRRWGRACPERSRRVKEAGLIPEEQVRLCVIGDGAKWIWKQAKETFPSAVQILDRYHLSEHLHKSLP